MEGGKAELAASAWEEKLSFIKAYIPCMRIAKAVCK